MTPITAAFSHFLSAIVVAAALRLVPHPPNFSPDRRDGAVQRRLSRQASHWHSSRRLAHCLLSDLVLGFYHGMATVYATVALIVVIGWSLSGARSPLRIGAAAIASSILFFVITNFGMWLFSGFYPRTLAGLEACYVAAIPFFQNTVAGDLFYVDAAVRRLPLR